jgi:hypothetical protein
LFAPFREGRCAPVGFPALTWKDVPALLEVAGSTDPLRAAPANPRSSRAPTACSEGVLALWLIEGVRRGGKWPSLNPILRGGGAAGEAPQRRAQRVHRVALQAYRAWWKKVSALPPAKAAAVVPLRGTGLSWY